MSSATLCENCEEIPAAVSCKECEMAFCDECGQVLHKSARKRTHQLEPVAIDRIEHAQEQMEVRQEEHPHEEEVRRPVPAPRVKRPPPRVSIGLADSIHHDMSPETTLVKRPSTNAIINSHSPDPRDLENWSTEDVCIWLASIHSTFRSYVTAFAENGIRGRTLPLLDDEALSDLGVLSSSHQQAILNAIIRLELEQQRAMIDSMLTHPLHHHTQERQEAY